jgi:uncharacterized protein (DUF433 family)
MATITVPSSRIVIDPDGRPRIDGTTYRVETVVIDHFHHGWSPVEISRQHYGEITPAQVHAALSFYYDNRDLVDGCIRESLEESERLRLEIETFQERFLKTAE